MPTNKGPILQKNCAPAARLPESKSSAGGPKSSAVSLCQQKSWQSQNTVACMWQAFFLTVPNLPHQLFRRLGDFWSPPNLKHQNGLIAARSSKKWSFYQILKMTTFSSFLQLSVQIGLRIPPGIRIPPLVFDRSEMWDLRSLRIKNIWEEGIRIPPLFSTDLEQGGDS